jgi:hypothetical protein
MYWSSITQSRRQRIEWSTHSVTTENPPLANDEGLENGYRRTRVTCTAAMVTESDQAIGKHNSVMRTYRLPLIAGGTVLHPTFSL